MRFELSEIPELTVMSRRSRPAPTSFSGTVLTAERETLAENPPGRYEKQHTFGIEREQHEFRPECCDLSGGHIVVPACGKDDDYQCSMLLRQPL